MRLLLQKNGQIIPQFNVTWEISLLLDLSQKGTDWALLYLEGNAEPIGQIHTTTHEVLPFEGREIKNRQVVVIGPSSTPS